MDLLDRPLALFYDATRARVLDALLSAREPLSGRQIARLADLSPTTVNGALEDLEERGIVRSRTQGLANLWSLQEESALVEQIRQLGRVQDELAGQVVVDALGAEPLSVTLFGSTARGESGVNSDVDLLLVAANAEQDLLFRRRAYKASSALRNLVGRSIHVTVMNSKKLVTPQVRKFIAGVLEDGRTLRGASIRELVS